MLDRLVYYECYAEWIVVDLDLLRVRPFVFGVSQGVRFATSCKRALDIEGSVLATRCRLGSLGMLLGISIGDDEGFFPQEDAYGTT